MIKLSFCKGKPRLFEMQETDLVKTKFSVTENMVF